MATHKVQINRAPVLTLWATVVAERLGYDREAALTFGQAVVGLNAQSKGRRLGIFEEPPDPREAREPSGKEPGKPFLVMGWAIGFAPTCPKGKRAGARQGNWISTLIVHLPRNKRCTSVPRR